MRLVGAPGAVHHMSPPQLFYDPSDPTFGLVAALTGVPIGALPEDGDAGRAYSGAEGAVAFVS